MREGQEVRRVSCGDVFSIQSCPLVLPDMPSPQVRFLLLFFNSSLILLSILIDHFFPPMIGKWGLHFLVPFLPRNFFFVAFTRVSAWVLQYPGYNCFSLELYTLFPCFWHLNAEVEEIATNLISVSLPFTKISAPPEDWSIKVCLDVALFWLAAFGEKWALPWALAFLYFFSLFSVSVFLPSPYPSLLHRLDKPVTNLSGK